MATAAPEPVSRLRATGRAFADRNYRLFFAGQGVSLVGTWMSRLATGWLVFRLGGPAASVGRHMVEGVRYAFGFAPIRALLLLLALVSFAAMPYSVLSPVFAADVLGGGPHALGLLSAASGLGALAGALYLASRSSVLGLGRVIVIATLTLGLALVGFSRSGSLGLSAALLVLAGAGMMIQMAAANTLTQTTVDEDKRGRVMGFFGMAFQGAAPSGSLLAGWLAGHAGVRAVVAGSGALVLLGGLAFATQLPRLRRPARPVYARLGILREAAAGANAATELAPGPRA